MNFMLNEDGTLHLVSLSTKQKEFVIPAAGNYEGTDRMISSIGGLAFSSCSSLEKLMFAPNSQVKYIDQEAFAVSQITSIVLPASLVSFIPTALFYYSIGNIDVEDGGKHVLKSDGIIYNTIPPSILKQHNCCFKYLYIRESITRICSKAFFKNCFIKYLVIPSSVRSIDEFAFAECNTIKKISFAKDSQLEIIDQGAFIRCSTFESIYFPDSLITIMNEAFSQCKNLRKIYFGQNSKIISIKESAFEDCDINFIHFPSSLQEIGKTAFWGLKKCQFNQDSKLTSARYAFTSLPQTQIIAPKNILSIIDIESIF